MAVIGTIESWFLAPGVSANRRLYTPEVIEKALTRLQGRLADPTALPVTMLSHHAAGDDSKELCARVVTAELDDQHRAKLSGYLVDTRAGRDIAAATEPDADGRRVLDAVSIRGWWLGPVRTVEVDGVLCETGDDLEIDGIDFTKSPGVAAARITGATRTTTESDARTPITESVEVSVMASNATGSRLVHTTSTPTREATTAAKTPAKPYGDVTYADPGYQADKKKRYPLDTPAHIRAAWSYINQDRNQKAYTASQVASIKAAIKKAAKAKGITIATETADLTPEAFEQLLEQLWEARVAISGWQGPVDLDLSAYGIDNADVPAAAALMGKAFDSALMVLDPDQDNDLDLPDGDEIQSCPSCGADLPDGAAFCPGCGADLDEAAADTEAAPAADKEDTVSEKKDQAAESGATETAEGAEGAAGATETTAPEGAAATTEDDATTGEGEGTAAPTPDPALVSAIATAVASQLGIGAAPTEAAKPAAQATETAEKPAEQAATTATTEAAPAAPALTAEQVQGWIRDAVTAATGASAQLTREAVVDQVRAEMVEAYGTPGRKGLVEAAKAAAATDDTPLHKLSPEEFTRRAAQAWDPVFAAQQ